MIAAALAYLARAIAGVSVHYTDSPPDARQRVYFANHCSHLDFLVIWASLPEEARRVTRPVAAADYWDRGRLRRYLVADVFHAVLVERGKGGGREAVARLLAALEVGDSLIIFPEGTRGDGESLGGFKAGLYFLAEHRPGLELMPVHLENLNRVLPKGEGVPVPLMSRVVFGAALTVAEGEDKDRFLARARAAVLELAAA